MEKTWNKAWDWIHIIGFSAALAILLLSLLCSFGKPIDVDLHITERVAEEISEESPREKEKYERISEKIENGTATEEEKEFSSHYILDHLSCEQDRAGSDNDGGGTYSNGQHS